MYVFCLKANGKDETTKQGTIADGKTRALMAYIICCVPGMQASLPCSVGKAWYTRME